LLPLETAKWVSEKTGQRTVHREQRTYTGSRFALWLPHVIASEGETQRPLLTHDEVQRLPQGSAEDPREPGDLLVFVTGHAPVHGKKIRFYQDREFVQRATDYLPPEASDRIPHDWWPWRPPPTGGPPPHQSLLEHHPTRSTTQAIPLLEYKGDTNNGSHKVSTAESHGMDPPRDDNGMEQGGHRRGDLF
jgi:type IV secretory pathway TraG/TraD family ATPase VirD4